MDKIDLDAIPFSAVGMTAWHDLANKLDPETGLTGNNWKILAEKLGFSTEHILNIDARQTQHGRNTLKLFEDYIKRNGNSVGAVKKALEEMERPDALGTLNSHIPDIVQSYIVSRNKQDMANRNRTPVQNSCYDDSTHCSSLGFHGHGLRTPPPAHCQSSHYQLNFHGKNSHASLMYPAQVFNDLSRNGNSPMSNSNNQTKDLNVVMTSSFSNGHGTGSQIESYSSFTSPENLSKIVHIDPSESYTSEEMDVSDDYDQREEGQPLAAAIQRDQRYRNIAKKPCLTNVDNAECDMKEESPPVNLKRRELRLNIEAPAQFLQSHHLISPSPSPASGSGTPQPLAQLNQFTNSDSYMPGVSYNAIMEEKNQQEFEQGRRAQNRDPNFKVPGHRYPHQINGRMLDFHVRSAMPEQTSAIRKVESELPRTFPLVRNKDFIYSSSGQSKERPSLLKSSISVPSDMKPAEYRKVFKHIKVFVTYAGDSKRHIQRVLNLCRCLEKNGFTCCMDMFDKRMEISNRQDWCAQRFTEADFILMCVSQQYKDEVDAFQYKMDTHNTIDDKELHIQFIYSLMLAEYKNNGCRNVRVIPLLFEGSNRNQIPSWLQNTYHYEWPKQYQDLLWCLTKPHTRIKPRTQLSQSSPSSPNERQSVSL